MTSEPSLQNHGDFATINGEKVNVATAERHSDHSPDDNLHLRRREANHSVTGLAYHTVDFDIVFA